MGEILRTTSNGKAFDPEKSPAQSLKTEPITRVYYPRSTEKEAGEISTFSVVTVADHRQVGPLRPTTLRSSVRHEF